MSEVWETFGEKNWTSSHCATCVICLMILISFVMSFPVGLAVFGGILVIVGWFIKSLITTVDTLPTLYYKESTLNTHLLNKSSILRRPFRPLSWLKNKHLQTLAGIFRPQPTINLEREYLQMSDRGVVALDWLVNNIPMKRTSPTLLIIPAINGEGGCVANICVAASQKGYRTVIFNSRGHGKSYLTTKKLQSFGDPMDVRQTVLYLRQKHPKSNIVSLAIGTGSTVLFSYLGEYGSSSRLKAAAFISPIYDTTDILSQGVPKFYEFLFLTGLKRVLFRHAQALSETLNIADAMKTFNISSFIKKVYCKLYGNDSLDQFLEKNNPMRDVDDISTPVLCLNSVDDPICQKHDIPFDIFQFYPNMLLITTENGGHCGFLENFNNASWGESFALDYFSAVLEFTANQVI